MNTMKKYIYTLSSIISLMMVSCQNDQPFDESTLSKNEGITFHISAPTNDNERTTRGGTA